MKTLPRFALIATLTLVVAACGDDDAATTTTASTPTTTVAPATTSTAAAETTTTAVETTTTVEPTTTTLGTGVLVDPFDGSTPAILFGPETRTGFDLSVDGFLTISSLEHSSPGVGTYYFATYNHFFRDGVLTMRFRPGPGNAMRYSVMFWIAAELSNFVEVGVGEDSVEVIGVAPGDPNTQQFLAIPPGTFDPAGFNELKVQTFDGVIEVFLNGVGLGEVFDVAPVHEGTVGFALVATGVGAEMTLDEFSVQPEVS
jgi:hypothetical protein